MYYKYLILIECMQNMHVCIEFHKLHLALESLKFWDKIFVNGIS